MFKLLCIAGAAASLALLLLATMPSVSLAADPKQPAGLKLALLIGVQKYANLGPGEQLNGSANDLAAMQGLLLDERFGFRPDDVATLLNEAATAENIRAAMQLLVARIDKLPGDGPVAQVVFHYSGHGSQIADQPAGDADSDEDDGLDETLVPYDASKQGGSQDIRDDELNRFAEGICAAGKARLFMVLDCCHSGTGARGATQIRKLDRNLPRPGPDAGPREATERRLPAGAVVLSACRAREVEPEYQEGTKHFGLLTRFVVQVLSEKPKLSDLSYDLLRQAVAARYRQDSSVMQPPMPQLEGDGVSLRGAVLGSTEHADRRPYWNVAVQGAERGVVLLKAGAFHGVTAGSLYELYEQPDQIVWQPAEGSAQNNSVGWLKIEQVAGATAAGRVFQWKAETPEPVSLAANFKEGVAVERLHQHGEFGLRLRIVRADEKSGDGPALNAESKELPSRIAASLAELIENDAKAESNWLSVVADDAPCDLILRIDGDCGALFPMTGRQGNDISQANNVPTSPLTGGWGPIDFSRPDAAATLVGFLRRICRARNLVRLAETQGQAKGGDTSAVTLELLSVEVDPQSESITKSTPWPLREGSLTVKRGDLYAYRVTNRDQDKPWYTTILHIDPDMGIDQVLPFQEGDGGEAIGEQELRGGESRVTDAFACQDGFGPRLAVALATREPNNYYMLSQPSLPKVRSTPTRGSGTGMLDSGSSLSQLLMEQTYFQTRGGDRRRRPQKLFDESWSAATLPFHAER